MVFYTCVKAVQHKDLSSFGSAELAFVSCGYANWQDAAGNTGAFCKHESSSCHKEAFQVMFPQTRNVGDLISSNHTNLKEENRKYLLKIAQGIRYLARQGLPLCGDGNEVDSNFNQLLLLHGIDDSKIFSYFRKKTDKHNGSQIQNDIIQVIADSVSTTISTSIQNRKYFSLMVDEAADSSNRVVICLHSVD